MQSKKVVLCIGSLAALVSTAQGLQAAVLNAGDVLTINAGVVVYDGYGNQINVTGGSWFSVDTDNNGSIHGVEKVALSQGTDGLVIGYVQQPGEITAAWQFFANYSTDYDYDYTTQPVTGGTTNGLDLGGWTWLWHGLSVPLGSGAWTPVNCASLGIACTGYADGEAVFSWSGVYGDSYTLNYAATIPPGDPSGWGGNRYFLHLEGTVTNIVIDPPPPVPVPAAVWLFGSGLAALFGLARRRSK